MKLTGNPVSAGIAIGPALLYHPFVPNPVKGEITAEQVPGETARYKSAQIQAAAELKALIGSQTGDRAAIFESHLDILTDIAMEEDILLLIEDEHCTADFAVHTIYRQYASVLAGSSDPLIAERAADLSDVSTRIQRVLAAKAEQNLSALEKPVVVVAHDLLPSQTAGLDRDKVLGIVAEVGGSTSHSAIIARGYGIPAVLGVSGAMSKIRDGEELILDAIGGKVLPSPGKEDLQNYTHKQTQHKQHQIQVRKYQSRRPAMADGTPVEVHLNIGSCDTRELEGEKYVSGVGLLRSEFLYMNRQTLPTEDEQTEAYKRVLLTFGRRPVILRTLDIGGDKQLDCLPLPKEDNPVLGNRALRLCFSRPELFHTQLRAALRASVHGNLWLMFPMVSGIDDIRRAKTHLRAAREELAFEGHPVAEGIQIGVMIETPSLAIVSDAVAREVDFASIGSNDLTQYTLAADRMNPAVSEYYQPCHPAIFRLIGIAAGAFAGAGKPLGVCGELAGDPLASAALIGLGIRKLSMGIASVAGVKRTICNLTVKQTKTVADTVVGATTADEVAAHLQALGTAIEERERTGFHVQ